LVYVAELVGTDTHEPVRCIIGNMVHSCLRIELCAKGECNPLAQSEMMNTSHL